MVILQCKRCGKDFNVNEYDMNRRKYCKRESCYRKGKREAMKRYRETDRGKAMIVLQNARYKRPEKEFECYVCKKKFKSVRKRNTCDSCIEEMIASGYKNPELAVNMRIWKAPNPERQAVYSKTSAITRRLKGRDGKPPTMKASCLVCGVDKIEQHHHDYSRCKDVTFLCKPHHRELHNWDSN